MKLLCLTDQRPLNVPYPIRYEEKYLVLEEYMDKQAAEYFAEAEEWCFEVYHHYFKEDYSYDRTEKMNILFTAQSHRTNL